jgi:flavin reductase (DIM6/NTAB) family NADH-FMN oxidoreductase RutF
MKKEQNTLLQGYKTVDTSTLSVVKLHQYLLSAVAPRPIALVSTRNKKGEVNLSPFSYFNVFGANPPLLIFSPARRVRDNTLKHTLENVREYPFAVVNMVDFSMVEQMSLSSTEYDEGVNEFVKSGLTEMASENIEVPRVAEAPVAFECKIQEVLETGKEGGAGNLVLAEVVKIHISQRVLDDSEMIDPLKMDLVGRMGGSWYTRTTPATMFEIPKPLKTKGIGVDQLPDSAKNSHVLTGNNLGRLGNAERLPSKKEIDEARNEWMALQGTEKFQAIALNRIHQKVQELLENNEMEKALAWLWMGETII